VFAPGFDGELVAFEDWGSLTLDRGRLCHRHPVSPYSGRAVTGVVRRTWLRGRPAGAAPDGRLLARPDDPAR